MITKIRNREYWLKSKEEVMASEDSYKKKQLLNKIDDKLRKIGVPFYVGNGVPYRKKVNNADNQDKKAI